MQTVTVGLGLHLSMTMPFFQGLSSPVCVVPTYVVSFVRPKIFTRLRDKRSTNCILDSIRRTHLVLVCRWPQHSSELWWPASNAQRLLLRALACKGRTEARIKTSPCGRLSPSGQSFISRLLAEARDCTVSPRDNFPGREAKPSAWRYSRPHGDH